MVKGDLFSNEMELGEWAKFRIRDPVCRLEVLQRWRGDEEYKAAASMGDNRFNSLEHTKVNHEMSEREKKKRAEKEFLQGG